LIGNKREGAGLKKESGTSALSRVKVLLKRSKKPSGRGREKRRKLDGATEEGAFRLRKLAQKLKKERRNKGGGWGEKWNLGSLQTGIKKSSDGRKNLRES